jgi:RHS repeat-associated protein
VNPYYVVKNSLTESKHIMMGNERVVTVVATIANRADPTTAGANTVFYYHPDHLQSTGYVTGGDGSILQHDEYFPSGEVWFQEQKNNDARNAQSYVFNAKELDETGLYYFGGRYYNPKFSMWQSPDPIFASYVQGHVNGGVRNPANLGLYSYAYNNPVVIRDPTGLSPADEARKQGMHPIDLNNVTEFVQGGCQSSPGFNCIGTGMEGGTRKNIYSPANGAPNGIDNPTLSAIGRILDEKLPGETMNPDTKKEIEGLSILLSAVLPLLGASKAALLLDKQFATEAAMEELASGGGKAMAGAGATSGRVVDDLPRLISEYGGTAKDWAKISTRPYRFSDGTAAEAHAYRNVTTGETVEIKTKMLTWSVGDVEK